MRRYLILVAMLLSACGGRDDSESKLRYVRYEKVKASDGMQVRTFAGLTHSGVESKISFKVPGTIEKLDVKIGDWVNAGEMIAEIDPNDYSLQVEETEAALLQAKAQERHAAASYARIRDLYETQSTSRNELDASRAESESASAAVEAMQKKLALARSQLSYTSLKAPQSGSIAAVSVEINENVKTGQHIVVLNSGSNLEVTVAIPEILISKIKKGEEVIVTFDTLPGKDFEGYVTEVGVASNVGTTFPVTVALEEDPPEVRSGMAAEVVFNLPEDNQGYGLFVPSQAVIGKGNECHLFVVNPTDNGIGIIERRDVIVGGLNNKGLEVISGINEGDFIVTAGIHSLKEGMKVKLLD